MAIARALPWDGYPSFVDVGTAQGDLVVQGGRGESAPLRTRIRPPGGRARLRGVCYGERGGGADLLLLVGKACDALPEGGAFVVYEALIDYERRENAFGLLMSLDMFIETREGGP